LTKQVKGLKAKNNELIREHVEMMKDKHSFGIQLQNQRLDIKRLTSLQSIHTARVMAESCASKIQPDEKTKPSFMISKSSVTEVALKTAAERRMSSFFAIDQISDELAQVALRSENIENIEPSSRSPQFHNAAIMMKKASAFENVDGVAKKMEKLQCLSGSWEVPMSETECVTGKTKPQPQKTLKCGASIEKLLLKQSETQPFDDGAQGKPLRQKSQVNYKEARYVIECVKNVILLTIILTFTAPSELEAEARR
jgi:hypothetical protein